MIPANQCISLILVSVLKDFERNPSYFLEYCDIVFNSKVRKMLVLPTFLHILFNSKILHASLRVIPVNQCDSLILVRVFKVFEQNHSYFLEYCDIAFNSKIRKMLVYQRFLHILFYSKVFAKF